MCFCFYKINLLFLNFFLNKGEKAFFLKPNERLENGIQDVYVLTEDQGLVLKAIEAFEDQQVKNYSLLYKL